MPPLPERSGWLKAAGLAWPWPRVRKSGLRDIPVGAPEPRTMVCSSSGNSSPLARLIGPADKLLLRPARDASIRAWVNKRSDDKTRSAFDTNVSRMPRCRRRRSTGR